MIFIEIIKIVNRKESHKCDDKSINKY